MYDFAIVALLGLAVYKTTEFVVGLLGLDLSPAIKTFVTLGLGVLATELLDYSVFAAWGVSVRDGWMGPFFTGLIVGGMTYVWHEVLGYVGGSRRGHTEEIESRTPRAA
jgi:hypothetical protein